MHRSESAERRGQLESEALSWLGMPCHFGEAQVTLDQLVDPTFDFGLIEARLHHFIDDDSDLVFTTGGTGMNTAIASAHNLAWKLAMVISKSADPALLNAPDNFTLPARDLRAYTGARWPRSLAPKPLTCARRVRDPSGSHRCPLRRGNSSPDGQARAPASSSADRPKSLYDLVTASSLRPFGTKAQAV